LLTDKTNLALDCDAPGSARQRRVRHQLHDFVNWYKVMKLANLLDTKIMSMTHPCLKTFIFFFLLIIPRIASAADINTGTIIVIAQAKERVIIAADSRTGSTNDGVNINAFDDDACKIAAFRRNVIFSAAGVLGSKGQNWTAVSLAADIIKRYAPSQIGSKQCDVILEKWAEAMMQRLQIFSSDQLLSYATANDGHITTAVLAGIENDKKVWVHAVMVNFSSTQGLSYQGYTLTSNDPPTAYYFLGKSEICNEFEKYKTSTRAIKEQALWNRKNLKGASFDRFKAHRLVELTIMYNINKTDVGGAVDEIEIDASSIRWINVKPSCAHIYP
jgi:hypothetical protein